MTDFDSIWRTQDEIRTVVNAVLGECIWNLSYNERRMVIELELTEYLEEENADALICQFPVPADYDGAGSKGTYLSPCTFLMLTINVPPEFSISRIADSKVRCLISLPRYFLTSDLASISLEPSIDSVSISFFIYC